MRKLIILFILLVLISSPVFAVRKACLTGTDSVLQNLLLAFGMEVTTSCTSGYSAYDIIVDDGDRSDVRAAAKPTVLIGTGQVPAWGFSECGDVNADQTNTLNGLVQGSIADNVPSDPEIYTSQSGTENIWYMSQEGVCDPSTAIANDAYVDSSEFCCEKINVWWWDTSDFDNVPSAYQQKGVFIGFVATDFWTANASLIFNNSVSYVCPYCADECNPPETGNWEINKTCNIKNQDINVTGNVSIFDNGFLNLTGSGGYLNFLGSDRYIFIYPGGELSLDISATIGKWPPS